MLKAQNIKTNNQYIIAVKCQESQRLQTQRQPLKKKKTHSAEPQFASMNICSAESAINVE